MTHLTPDDVRRIVRHRHRRPRALVAALMRLVARTRAADPADNTVPCPPLTVTAPDHQETT